MRKLCIVAMGMVELNLDSIVSGDAYVCIRNSLACVAREMVRGGGVDRFCVFEDFVVRYLRVFTVYSEQILFIAYVPPPLLPVKVATAKCASCVDVSLSAYVEVGCKVSLPYSS